MPYNWEINTIVENMSELEPQDLNELIISLDKNMEFIMDAVVKQLKGKLRETVEDEELCPKCFAKLEYGDAVRELMGRVGDAPAYQYIPTKMVCRDCDYYEDL